jgi:large subunit ribosomal protein L30
MSGEEKIILAIRLRGPARVRPEIEDTLGYLRLRRVHHARFIKLTSDMHGMIMRAKDYITWGPIDENTATLLISKRGRISGNEMLTDEYVRKNSSYKSVDAFAKALVAGTADISDIEGLKPVFRLTPPKKGFKGKRNLPVKMGGVTGDRGQAINELVQRMI